MLSYLQQNPQIRQNLMSAVSTVGRQAANALGFPTGGTQTNNSFRQVTKRAGRKSKKTSRSGRLSHPSKGVSYTPRMEFHFVVPINTVGVTGIVNQTFWPGYADTGAGGSMSSISTQYANIAAIFAYQSFHSIKIKWEPYTAFTTSGWAGAQFYPDPTIGPATTINSAQLYTQRRYNFVTDVKNPATMVWHPEDEQDREAKEVSAATGVTGGPRRNYSPGLIFLGATTNLIAGANLVGHMILSVDLTFSGMQ